MTQYDNTQGPDGVHTADCAIRLTSDATECHSILDGPGFNAWNQPPREYVDRAEADLLDGTPWCRIRVRAFELLSEDEGDES